MMARRRTRVIESSSSSSDHVQDFVQKKKQQSPPPASLYKRTLESTAYLANLLPTGTLLAFQLLTPVFTNNGSCDAATRPMTFVLLVILAVSCFLASFTDSFKASDGQIYYGFATPNGLWVFDQLPDAPAAASGTDLFLSSTCPRDTRSS